ncbi:tetraspanin-4-like [Hydra vulgaris]|uniref:Tetraspanin n=1 Tax=Hydra vulgaris TaxID=6087 RepID=A0ABM4BD92_HYDVU
MSLSGGKMCVKYLMFIFNFLFLIMGAVLLGVGIWLKVDKSYSDIADQFFSQYSFLTASNIAIGVGVFIVFISFLGCCGAVKEIRSMLFGFFILMLLIFIAEIVVAAFAYSKRNDIKADMQNDFKKAILQDYGTPNNGIVNTTIDTFQKTFMCCGYDSYIDYYNSIYTKNSGTLPSSCCVKDTSDPCPTSNPKYLSVYYQKGCFEQVVQFIKKNLLLIGGLSIAFAVIQILGMVFSLVLFCALGGKGEYV